MARVIKWMIIWWVWRTMWNFGIKYKTWRARLPFHTHRTCMHIYKCTHNHTYISRWISCHWRGRAMVWRKNESQWPDQYLDVQGLMGLDNPDINSCNGWAAEELVIKPTREEQSGTNKHHTWKQNWAEINLVQTNWLWKLNVNSEHNPEKAGWFRYEKHRKLDHLSGKQQKKRFQLIKNITSNWPGTFLEVFPWNAPERLKDWTFFWLPTCLNQ